MWPLIIDIKKHTVHFIEKVFGSYNVQMCKLIFLKKLYMNCTKYQVRVDETLSEDTFREVIELKLKALSPLFF